MKNSIIPSMDIRCAVAHSADAYLACMKAKGQTTSPVKLRGKPLRNGNKVYLPLALRSGMEPTELTLNDRNANIIRYMSDKALLEAELGGEITDERINALEVRSDISFLAKRIRDRADQQRGFAAGEVWRDLAANPLLISDATVEQQRAIYGILNSPLSYVWGVPGAGKTCVVLAECIARYILTGKKVLLIAPTNTALDKALKDILPVLDALGIRKNAVLRLGIASPDLARKYPAVSRDISVLNLPDAPQLVAATADTMIGKYDILRRFNPNHVFLDEAGNCPLIKALPLLTFGCPLALLGDHKQLPPVCTLEWREIRDLPELCLWSLSAIYIGNMLQARSVEQLTSANKPDFTLLRKYNLGDSYRFGGELADILSDTVYEGILRGMAPVGTSISVYHAPRMGNERMSPNEAHVIARLLNGTEPENCAVITPYRKQAALLHKTIPNGDVMTIHKAQGLEWDTVIISAVDAEEMLFCDSTKSRGNALLNTALSRAKKHLVIVCDAECWAKRPRQLLGKLVLAAGGTVA